MERRVFLVICLSILVMYAYQVYFLPPPAPAVATKPATAPATTPPTSEAEAPAPQSTEAAPSAVPAAVVSESTEREIVIETSKVQVVATNRGGRILHWRLKDYPDPQGKPVDLVPSNLPPMQPLPFSLAVDDQQLTRRMNDALYRVSTTDGRVDATTAPATVGFEYEDASGLHVRKEFGFQPSSYVVTFSADLMKGAERLNPTIQWGPGLGDLGAAAGGGSIFTGNAVQAPSAIFHRAGDVVRVAAKEFEKTPVYEDQFLFAGIDDHYFLAAAIEPGKARLDYRSVSLPGPGQTERHLVSQSFRLAAGVQKARFFVGPKQLETLRAVGINGELAYAINFGRFSWLVLPLLQALKWVHGFVGNYGWSIIILTILINLVMFPLRHKSLVSMRKTQALQPQIKAIQERYSDLKMTDPARQKMNTDIMNLYREKGVNPAAGCVPMLLTMPVLFAFYSMLSQAIELRGADFGFWIHDLSVKDPYYVTPLLMGVTMFAQMWISPTTADPAQQRMMMFMPIVFTVMFLGFPSGLAIYYLVSNLFQIGQQQFTNWVVGPPPAVQAARAPAERKLKNVGAGRTAAADRKN